MNKRFPRWILGLILIGLLILVPFVYQQPAKDLARQQPFHQRGDAHALA